MGLNTTITGPVQIRTRLSTGVAGFPGGALYPRELFYNRADKILYQAGDTVDGNGFSSAFEKLGGIGAFVAVALLGVANGVAPLDAQGYVPLANISPTLTGAMNFQGVWNPLTNTPQLISGQGTKGYLYKVNTRAVSTVTTSSASTASGSATISVASAAGLTKGMLVTGAGIAANTTVTNIAGTTISISPSTSGAVSNGQNLTFSPYLDGVTQFYPGDQVVFDGTTWDKIEGSATEVYTVAGQTGDVVLSVTDISGAAPIASPTFTGTPSAPSPAIGDNSTRLATTGWATGKFATLDSPTFTGVPSGPTAVFGTNTTQLATAAFVQQAVAGKRTPVADAAYTVLATDRNVAYATLTAARIVSLPAASAYPVGTLLVVYDESGSCSTTNTITVARNGSDTINGASSVVLNTAYSYVALQSNGSAKWTVVDLPAPVFSVAGRGGAVTLTSADLTDASTVGRALLTAASTQAQRDALQIENYLAIADQSGTIGATVTDAVMTSMTAARTLTLPLANSVKAGRCITVGDESGQCSTTNTLTTAVQGSDTINGASTDVQVAAYANTRYRSNGSSKWTIVSKVPATSAGGVDGGTV